ncbi:MAG: SPFH domain-containing protein [Candidatus Helarchaeota archaeon]
MSIGVLVFFLILGLIFAIWFWASRIVVVPPNEAHVVVSKKKRYLYDGKGRYMFIKLLHRRLIIPKVVIDVDIPDIRLHDKDNLPFVVKISCKVQVKNPEKAAETLGADIYKTLRRIVDDTVQSAARTICMQKDILSIMRERENVEEGIYSSLSGSFVKLGLEPIIFDIKDITDVKGSSVIRDLERVKSAELDKNARIAEAFHDSEAKRVEAEKHKEATVTQEQMMQAEKEAEIEKEKFVVQQTEELVRRKMAIKELETKRGAEIEREKEVVLANAKAEAVKIQAEAEAQAIKLKAEAEAAGVRAKAKALEEYAKAGESGIKMKSLELIIDGVVRSSKEIAEGLKQNSKVVILGGGSDGTQGNSLMNLIPMAEVLKETGILKSLTSELKKGLEED